MGERKKKSATISDGGEERIQRIEALFEEVEAHLRQLELRVEEESDRARQWESKISERLAGEAAGSGAGQIQPQSLIALEEGAAVDLDEWERRIDEKYAALSAKEKQLGTLEKNIHAELEQLRGEIKKRDILLVAKESELKTLRDRATLAQDDREALIGKRPAGRKPGRLVSFLVDIGKKH
jgi:hypothetical protein